MSKHAESPYAKKIKMRENGNTGSKFTTIQSTGSSPRLSNGKSLRTESQLLNSMEKQKD